MPMDVDEIIKKLNPKFRNIEGKKLIIAIAVDGDKNVLMTAFMSEESLRKTLETGLMHYYSTSRDKIWMKGEESGKYKRLKRFIGIVMVMLCCLLLNKKELHVMKAIIPASIGNSKMER